jgi:hypothetical protein
LWSVPALFDTRNLSSATASEKASDEVHKGMALLGFTHTVVREASEDNVFATSCISANIRDGDRWQRAIIPAASAEDAMQLLQISRPLGTYLYSMSASAI